MLTKKTTATFSMNAHAALAMKVGMPTALNSSIVTWGTSIKRATMVFMTAQTGAK